MSNTEPLRRLLKDAAHAQRLSVRDLETAAKGRRGKSWLADLQNVEHRPNLLSDEELDVVSAAYRVPRRAVREADLAGHGLQERDRAEGAFISEAEVAHLASDQRAAIKHLLMVMAPLDQERVRVTGWANAGEYDRAADTGRNRGVEIRTELDRQAEMFEPPPDHDEGA